MDQVKTTFTFMGQKWMFAVVPFGLKMAPGYLQHVTERLLAPMRLIPLLDDCPIASFNAEEHKQKVLEVLKVLTYNAEIRIRVKKCKFFQTECRIFGYTVGRDGIKIDPAKVKAILNWPPPVNGKAMQRFLGAANFHREFSAKYADIAAPLEGCRNISGKIDWTPKQLQAFDKLKQLFADDILL